MESSGWFDSHAHFGSDIDGTLERARAAGLSGLVAVGGSDALNAGALRAARAAPGWVRLALGWDRAQTAGHPSAAEAGVQLERQLQAAVDEGLELSALGEIGLDYHHDSDSAAAQRALFEHQVALAGARGLPIIVHSREADADTLAILRGVGSARLASEGRLGVLHCFTGTAAFAAELLAMGLCLSFSGIVTFRNADSLRAVAREIPDDRLLVETDCPYLTPAPLRGRPNEPAFVGYVGRCLAVLRGQDEAELAAATRSTAHRLFSATGATPAAG